ncbi:EF-P lysine aminoacylase GenX [Phreatobacter aquaticus]|uniref:EF-P lysine aminoacylase GenX n=1 Tax=Phreatobacter aquaticus TaxID=2570229 RepID=A0A4D7QJZ5_9HYPH|nr:EF-P lysine aminoacylase EpmA [Phreatobacter aquaticus]QCK84642.1 EF-P lysine aminoacylase GenX [Phreatobacter aquaticus]
MPDLPSPWWTPERHADRKPFLAARGRVKRALGGWFDAQGFTEVEAGILQVSPGNEAHLHAFETQALTIDGRRAPLYLHTSPEFAAKKLIAAGETRIVDFARVFRNRERGPLHHPEFTMVEWYRVGASYEQLMADCVDLMRVACEAAGSRLLSWKGATADPALEPERVTLAEAFAREAGIDLLATVDADGTTDRVGLAAQAMAAGIRVAEDDGWADIFSKVLVERVEPRLGFGRPTILCDYPVSEAALARPKASDPRVAERFELYACGVELANGFGELTDPAEQRRRFEAEMAEKLRIYGEAYPIDEELLAALSLMPPTAGIALGFERLVMLASGARHIEDVIWTPVPVSFGD